MATWLIFDPEEIWEDGYCYWPNDPMFESTSLAAIIAKAGPQSSGNWNFMGVNCGRGVPLSEVKKDAEQ